MPEATPVPGPTSGATPGATPGAALLRQRLHDAFAPGAYDNWRVWAGALSVDVDGLRFDATLGRAWLRAGAPPPRATVRCELFVADVPAEAVRAGDVAARLWTDANETDGSYLPMKLRADADGRARPCGPNLVFESMPFELRRTGAFAYTVELSAQDGAERAWVAINDMGANRDGVLVVSPGWVAAAPSVTEVCVRKVGATVRDGRFTSGRFTDLTACLEQVPTDIVYLLPFFQTGHGDVHSGGDVRKGRLGSVYAVADFFRLELDLVTPPEQVDLAALAEAGGLDDELIADVFARVPGPAPAPPTAVELAAATGESAARRWGHERLVQIVGRVELRQLTARAHGLGKRVLFDLVLMQTSRDSHLVTEHPDWYVLDEDGRPQIHRIAWLVYSDVALFDLVFNRPLQDYLLEVAPYWMRTGGLDGVRIDASQTVDRPFLKRLKNRIQGVDAEALVMGETLCPLQEAVDVPVDMVYALLVDFHRDAQHAGPLIDFLEQMHSRLAAGTVAMAYFENHDSPRATSIWRQRFADTLAADAAVRRAWRAALGPAGSGADAALWMALLKNLQATLIDATAGMAAAPAPSSGDDERPAPAGGTQLAWAIEWGSDWGEETRTDFENDTLLHPQQRQQEPRRRLVAAYRQLAEQLPAWAPVRDGAVYYHRNSGPGGDAEDRVLAYTRHDGDAALVAVHNLDAGRARTVRLDCSAFSAAVPSPQPVFDTYEALGLPAGADPQPQGACLHIEVAALQSRLFRWSL